MTVEHDLARASVTSCTMEDLDMDPTRIQLDGRNFFGLPELRDALSSTYEVPSSNIVVTHGASMGIFLVLTSLLERGQEVLIEVPNYEPLYRIPKALECRVKILERDFEGGYELDLEQLNRKISSRTEAVILTNLHNPSGTSIGESKLRTISRILRDHDARLICGEAYLESVFQGSLPPAFRVSDRNVSIGSMSKAYGLGGLRVGWVFCDEELKDDIHSLENYMSPQNTYPAQQIAVHALRERDRLLKRNRDRVRENYEVLEAFVESREDVDWVPPDGGPICFFRIPREVDVWDLMKHLKEEYNTLVVPGDFFWARGFIRIGFGNEREDVEQGIEHLGRALDDQKRGGSIYR